ncbi:MULTISPECIES: helix-turn-helix transcriptional regulator [unclassified Streptomyces]|uniref:helix-turn-helix transcriptional regulator n=1 Tax=unclassified Streptomyces TaxID=2593676 RepID=UPI00332105E9
MTPPLSSAQAARTALATHLRHLRLDAGLAGHQLSHICGWHPAKTSRIENMRAAPSDADIPPGARRAARTARPRT